MNGEIAAKNFIVVGSRPDASAIALDAYYESVQSSIYFKQADIDLDLTSCVRRYHASDVDRFGVPGRESLT